jgi:transposase
MMNVTPVLEEVKTSKMLMVCCDVCKDSVEVYGLLGEEGRRFELKETLTNRTKAIDGALKRYMELAEQHGYQAVCVVCEPTGGYERHLLALARRRGCQTAYVSGEAVNKARIIESNDTGKSDKKDPRVIQTLASMGKTLVVRLLPGTYAELRELSRQYEDESNTIVTIRNRIHDVLKDLFPDLDVNSDFLFSATGRAVQKQFGFSPARLLGQPWPNVVAAVRKEVRSASKKKLEQVWKAAQASVLHLISDGQRQLLEARLKELFDDYDTHQARKQRLRERILEVYSQTEEGRKLAGIADVSQFQVARLIAETGPLRDFKDYRQVQRFLGLNLRQRQSGKYQGQNKISKKGRALGRKVLYQMAFDSLIGEKKLYGGYYRRKKATSGSGTRAIVCVMRKALKMIFGVFRSAQAFDSKRVFVPLERKRAA